MLELRNLNVIIVQLDLLQPAISNLVE